MFPTKMWLQLATRACMTIFHMNRCISDMISFREVFTIPNCCMIIGIIGDKSSIVSLIKWCSNCKHFHDIFLCCLSRHDEANTVVVQFCWQVRDWKEHEKESFGIILDFNPYPLSHYELKATRILFQILSNYLRVNGVIAFDTLFPLTFIQRSTKGGSKPKFPSLFELRNLSPKRSCAHARFILWSIFLFVVASIALLIFVTFAGVGCIAKYPLGFVVSGRVQTGVV